MKTKFVAVCVVAVTMALVLQETDGFFCTGRGCRPSKGKLTFTIAEKNKGKRKEPKVEKEPNLKKA